MKKFIKNYRIIEIIFIVIAIVSFYKINPRINCEEISNGARYNKTLKTCTLTTIQ